MARQPITPLRLSLFMLCGPFYVMLSLMLVEALLSAATTYLVIRAGRDVANNQFLLYDLLWILAAQSLSYVVGAVSWIYAERAGFLAFARYMMRFARDNRTETKLLTERDARERIEPFLTGETFYVYFHLLYEIEGDLRLLLALIFNVIVLGTEIDSSLPIAYAAVFAVLFGMQWTMRKRVASAYLENQRMTNRVTSQGYTAWDNVFAGNRYNLRLWLAGFKVKLRDSLVAQIKAIMTKEGLSAASAIVGLAIVFGTMAWVATRNAGNIEVLIALAATLPRQIEMTQNVHSFTSGWNELLAVWARMGGVANNMYPEPDPNYDARIKFDRLTLREDDSSRTVGTLDQAMGLILARPSGRVNVRGANGSGKSTLLTTLKAAVKTRAYYWPTADRLAFQFNKGLEPEDIEVADIGGEPKKPSEFTKKQGFSSGERQLRALQEIVQFTDAPIYLLDEWDANLDPTNRAAADALIEVLAQRARVVDLAPRSSLTMEGSMLTRRATLAGLAALGVPVPVRAQDFPNRAITIIVPYTPAGPIDTMARLVGQEMAVELRQPVVVENRPGGSGIIGTNAVARAAPDGYTLVFGTNQTHVTNQSLIKNCPYDAVKDFSPVANITVTPHVLVVRNDLAAASLADLVALAKSKPGALTFGTIGPGSSSHLATELFKLKAGIEVVHVPFKGLSPLATELLAGRIDLSIAPLPGLMQQQVDAGKVRALALASVQRTDFLPALPTFAEAGVPGVEADALGALFAPARTPPAVIDRLYRAVAVAVSKDNVRVNATRQGIPIVLKSPAEMSALLPAEVAKWANVIKLAGIPVE